MVGPWFGHTWSLAIEEQFYLAWPAVLLLARPLAPRRWRVLFALVVLGAVGSMLERVVLWQGQPSTGRVYFGTDTRADGLLLGCALALWLSSGRRLRCGGIIGIVGAGSLLAATALTGLTLVYIVAPTVAAIGGVLLIAYLLSGDRLFRWRALCHTGRISYGLYLWHLPLIWLLPLGGQPLSVRAPVVFGLSWAVALASYRWVEQPFLSRKRPQVTTDAAQPVPVGSPAS